MDLCEPILRNVCNVIVMVSNWEDSDGARYEFDMAKDLGYVSFLTTDQFFTWYEMLQN